MVSVRASRSDEGTGRLSGTAPKVLVRFGRLGKPEEVGVIDERASRGDRGQKSAHHLVLARKLLESREVAGKLANRHGREPSLDPAFDLDARRILKELEVRAVLVEQDPVAVDIECHRGIPELSLVNKRVARVGGESPRIGPYTSTATTSATLSRRTG